MKKIKIIMVFLGGIFLINSCNESDLELTNPNQLSPETFFKNESQVQASVNAIYANLQTIGMYTRHMYFMMDNMAHENAGNSQLEADKVEYLNFSFDSSHGGITEYWDSCFRGINKANFVLNNEEAINAIPESFLTQSRKDKFLGEAKFLRGLYYFYLVTRFGDVPLITTISEAGEGVPRSPKEQVYDQIIKDLQEASTTLLDKGAEEQGRATKGAAYALLGKVYLYRENYESALQALNQVTGYSLETDYEDNFQEETEHGPESIFEVEYNDDLGDGAKWNSNVSGAGPNEVTFRGQEYGMFDWFNVYPADNLIDEYEDDDIRFDETFYVVGDTTGAGVAINSIPNNRRAAWRKYQNYYKDTNEDQASGINMKVIRYADVLLMMAESANELGDQVTATGYINQVRERAGLSDLEDTLSKQQVFDAIVHERKVELAGEQVRFADLVRWGMAAEVLGQFGFQTGKSELLPIPNAEISSNENMTSADQNPGY
ncbi:RagB/SusD family nutrient uptake outer membrane protein [Flavimarina sp. Hel_I_48]|uniref:RagB/SusD family nutrient uptake outer membrane protein n=1 Tax=Flavimarina sp. Hel_I_48 TaxID=1392488 RepID=UPI0004DFC0AC|nr:RagB/SusD family nutrient uptake outer membrane protein [Flavimarina sp. Hel_I_48]